MKKKIIMLFTFVLMLSLTGCGGKKDNSTDSETTPTKNQSVQTVKKEEKEVQAYKNIDELKKAEIIAPKNGVVKMSSITGPTAIIDIVSRESESVKKYVNSTIQSTPEPIAKGLIDGSIDMAIIPANLAATLNQKLPNKFVSVASVVDNVVSILTGNKDIKKVEDIKPNMPVYAMGQGNLPEFLLRNIVGLLDVNANEKTPLEEVKDVYWYKTPQEVVKEFIGNQNSLAILPEPFATAVKLKLKKENGVDINKLENVNDFLTKKVGFTPVTGVLLVKKELAEDKEFINSYLNHLRKLTPLLNKLSDEKELDLLQTTINVKSDILKKVLGKTLIFNVRPASESFKKYINFVHENMPSANLKTLPEESFYYSEK